MKTLSLAAAAALLALGLGACSAGGGESASSSDSGVAQSAPEMGSAVGGAAAAAEDSAASVPRPAADVAAATSVQPEEARIVSTGTVSLRADDVRVARGDVQRVVDQAGGHVGDEDAGTDEDGSVSYAHLVLRVPSASYDDARHALEGVADLIESTTRSADVTTQVTDVDERVKAMRASLERMRTLLGAATRISDILRIESEITSREADLNSLLGQQAYLADQTSMSTITVDISRTDEALVGKKEERTGFLAGLSDGWDALTAFGTWLATILGAVLPWAPVIAIVGIPAWLLVRRSRRARRTARTPSAA